MKTLTRQLLLSVLMGLVIPGVILPGIMLHGSEKQEQRPPVQTGQAEKTEQPAVHIPVLLEDGQIRQMELEAYICGVVLAEMPVSFEPEAQKAQAVVARTYALRRFLGGTKHPGGAVCTDPNCCQGYESPEAFALEGGSGEGLQQVQSAVEQTRGQVLTYEGELIEATYFSCSGGMTEDARAVWGSEVPYLQAVPSPGEEAAAHYTDTFYFTRRQLWERLGLAEEAVLEIGQPHRTEGGGVEQIRICGEDFTGLELRRLLQLPSTDFSVSADPDGVTIVTYGFGHRVGMSQYGAEAMAVSGSSYRQILDYYYHGTALQDNHGGFC